MDPKILKQVVSQIHKRYPEFSESQPKVRRQPHAPDTPPPAEPNYLLTFKTSAVVQSASGSKTMSRYLRVVVNARGKLIKITTSR